MVFHIDKPRGFDFRKSQGKQVFKVRVISGIQMFWHIKKTPSMMEERTTRPNYADFLKSFRYIYVSNRLNHPHFILYVVYVFFIFRPLTSNTSFSSLKF